jgi:DNA repair protein RecO
MSHLKYTTPAFIVSSSLHGEADKTVYFYTKDFGMIIAFAKSVRLLKSKLGSTLEVGNSLSISLVKGKEVWRLTDVEVLERVDPQSRGGYLFLKIIKLLKSLVQGEEKNEKLFLCLEEAFDVLKKNKFPEDLLGALECLMVLRILDSLGYGRGIDELNISIFGPIETSLLKSIQSNQKIAINLINKSIKDSHL